MKDKEELIKNGKHFCILPWIHFHAWPNKQVMPCCVADSNMPVSEIKDDQSILEMMNSEEYKRMRLAMLNDEYYEPCRRCYELEDFNTWTMRQSQNTVRGLDNIDLIASTNDDGSIDEFKMKYMDIRFSNLCNFKCRSCGPACSNLWAEEQLDQMDNNRKEFEITFKLKDVLVSNTDNNDFMTKLKEHLPDVEECYFAGGEILVTPDHYECLEFWIENDLAKNIHLNYTTNMSKLTYKNKDIFEYWKHFKSIEIWASLDDVGERAELIRNGTRWGKIVENLRRIRDEAPNVSLGFTPTISIWNIWNYHKLFDFLYEEGLIDPIRPPRLNILTYPECAALDVLPGFIIKDLKKIYHDYQRKFDRKTERNSESVQKMHNTFGIIISALNDALGEPGYYDYPGKPELFMEFMDRNDRMDEYRDEFFLDVIPELREVYEWAKRETIKKS